MNVGFYVGNFVAEDGGGFTIQGEVIRALQGSQIQHHRFIFISDTTKGIVQGSRHLWLSLGDDDKVPSPVDRENSLLKIVSEQKLEYLVYLSPQWVTMDIPYMAIVWDLEHRLKPYFPELSSSPINQWQDRETHYQEYLRRAAHIITGTNAGREDIGFFYQIPSARIHLAAHPTPEDCLLNLPPPGSRVWQNPVLIYPAQFWPHKNHITLLKVLDTLHRTFGLRARLILVGADKGNGQHVLSYARQLNLTEYIDFLGFVTREELIKRYDQATCLVYLSMGGWENLPPLEAMARGLPVVAASVRGTEEQLGSAAVMVDPLDVQAIASAIINVHHDNGARERLIAAGLALSAKRRATSFCQIIINCLDSFSATRELWSSESQYRQLFSPSVLTEFEKAPTDDLPRELLRKEREIRLLSAAAEERLTMIKENEAQLVELRTIKRYFDRHWWTHIGRSLGLVKRD